MMPSPNLSEPRDANYQPEQNAVWVPGSGLVVVQGGTLGTDATTGTSYAPIVTQAQLRDANNNAFGTQGNPVATNQVVGTPVYGTATAAAAAACTTSLPATTGKTTYINGFVVSTQHPGANVFGTVTVSFDGGTTTHLNFIIVESATLGGLLQVEFPDPIPAKTPNTTIVVTLPAITGGGASAISIFGYQL